MSKSKNSTPSSEKNDSGNLLKRFKTSKLWENLSTDDRKMISQGIASDDTETCNRISKILDDDDEVATFLDKVGNELVEEAIGPITTGFKRRVVSAQLKENEKASRALEAKKLKGLLN